MDHSQMDHSNHIMAAVGGVSSSMDHTMPDHSMPDHSMPDHSMPDKEPMCSMNMIFTWDWKNTCIVFKWWHVKTTYDFIFSFIAVVLLGMGYEFSKHWFNKWQKSYINVVAGSTVNSNAVALRQYKIKQSLFYGFQVGYSFMLMLVFMTYNGWFMIAVVIGAVIGKQLWGDCTSDAIGESRSMACH